MTAILCSRIRTFSRLGNIGLDLVSCQPGWTGPFPRGLSKSQKYRPFKRRGVAPQFTSHRSTGSCLSGQPYKPFSLRVPQHLLSLGENSVLRYIFCLVVLVTILSVTVAPESNMQHTQIFRQTYLTLESPEKSRTFETSVVHSESRVDRQYNDWSVFSCNLSFHRPGIRRKDHQKDWKTSCSRVIFWMVEYHCNNYNQSVHLRSYIKRHA